MADEEVNCGSGNSYNGSTGLRIGAVFIILATSMMGTLFPIISKRVPKVTVPKYIFEFTKYFGSGVIIATAYIHLLDPAIDELDSPCLTGTWTLYPWALAISMISVFGIFILELVAYRFGVVVMERAGIDVHDTHGPGVAHGPEQPGNHAGHNHVRHGDEQRVPSSPNEKNDVDVEVASMQSTKSAAAAQIIGVAILEFGVVVHSIIIGLTLAVTDEFDTLFVVIIFHQMFEGLGLGTRLAFLPLPRHLSYVPFVAGIFYAFMTPIGMAIGLSVRTSYNPDGKTASIVSGILDAISSGILLWTGLVELLAHEFINDQKMREAPLGKVLFSVATVCLGAGIMALLGRWA